MASLSADRPSEVVLAARVARQYYLEGASKVDIADRLGRRLMADAQGPFSGAVPSPPRRG